jgi:hypothetical protein
MPTLGTTNGCAYTYPSTGWVNNKPNVLVLTLASVSWVSFVFWPVRALSLCQVRTDTGSAAALELRKK